MLGHLKEYAGRAIYLGDGVRIGSLQRHVRHLGQADGTAGGQGQEHIGHVVHRLELGVGGDRQGLGAVLHVAAGVEQIFRSQEITDIGIGQAVARRPGGGELYGDLLAHAAKDVHGGHTSDALQGRPHGVLRQSLQLRQVVAHQGHHGGGHHIADVQVDDDRVGAAVRQGEGVELLPQLGGGDIHVGAVHIEDLHGGDAVGGAGLDLIHAGDRHDGRFQGAGNQLLHVAGAGAVVVAIDIGRRVGHIGQQGHLELGGKDHAEDQDQDDRQKGSHLMLDAKF